MKQSKKQILRNLGNRLKLAREALGLNQREFAKKMEMSNTHLSDIEFGKCGPGYYFFFQLSLYHKINPVFILHGQEPMFLGAPEQTRQWNQSGIINGKNDWFGADSELMRQNVELMKNSPIVRMAVMQFVTQYALENKALIEADILSRQENQAQVTSGEG